MDLANPVEVGSSLALCICIDDIRHELEEHGFWLDSATPLKCIFRRNFPTAMVEKPNADRPSAVTDTQAEGIDRAKQRDPDAFAIAPETATSRMQLTQVSILGGVAPGRPWFTTFSFALPGANRLGDAGRNTVRGPHLSNYDFSKNATA